MGDLHIEQRGLNVGVTHQLHERRQAYPGTYHIGGKGVSKTMRVGERNASGSAMVAEQGAQSRSAHTGSARRSFERDEQCGAAWIGSFQSQIVIEQLNAFWRKREEAKFVAFATNAELRFRQQHVIPIQSHHFGGTEPMQEHQTHDGQVA